jgi:hypothetical protein
MPDKHGAIIRPLLLKRTPPIWILEQSAPCCGITQAPRKVYRSRLTILRALRDAVERCSKDDVPQTLRLEATHYFGSLRNAFFALRKGQKLLRGWSKQKIIIALSRMHRSKESLAYARARHDAPALVSAAELTLGVGVRLCMPLGSTQICILCITSGADLPWPIKK